MAGIAKLLEYKLLIGLAVVSAGAGGLFLVQAGGNTQEQVKTISYYAENKQEREQKIVECADSPGTAKDDPNCINATTSMSKEILNIHNPVTPRVTFEDIQNYQKKALSEE